MNDLGILSNSSAFKTSAYSVYGATRVSSVKNEQENSAVQKSTRKYAPVDDLEDKANISDEAMLLAKNELMTAKVEQEAKYQKTSKDENVQTNQNAVGELTPEEKQQVEKLKAIDSEVKTHERAHLAASGGIGASAPTYTYQKGPDGQNYAVAGQVQVKMSSSGNPDETIEKAKIMEAAALAPGTPSGQDMKVANNASQIMAKAKEEKNSVAQKQTDLKNNESKAEKTADN